MQSSYLSRALRLCAALVLVLTPTVVTSPPAAQAAAPVVRCETTFNRAGMVSSATGIFANNVGEPGGIPNGLGASGWTCPAASVDTDWTIYYGLDRYVMSRVSTSSIVGVTYYVYDVEHKRRDCSCTTFNIVGTQKWRVLVPYHYVPRLATNSGVLSDALYVVNGDNRVKLADLKFNLAFVEDPIGKLQRGYFSQLSVAFVPGTPTHWTYTASKTQGQACESYPETVGAQEYWYLRCDVDITFVDPTKRTKTVELQLGSDSGRENSKVVGGVKVSETTEVPATYVYYKFQVKVALGVTSYEYVRRVGGCQRMSLSYVVSTLNPYSPYRDVTDSWALHGGRCRLTTFG